MAIIFEKKLLLLKITLPLTIKFLSMSGFEDVQDTAKRWYEVTVAVKEETEKGIKIVKEPYLVKAVSVSDAETKVAEHFAEEGMQFDYRVAKATEKIYISIIG